MSGQAPEGPRRVATGGAQRNPWIVVAFFASAPEGRRNFAIVKKIIDAGGQFLSLAEHWADTSTSTGRLMIAVLGGLADVERDSIRTRTGEGRARAKLRGQHMGRPPKMTAAQKQEARRRRKDGESVADLARSYGVSPAAIYRTTAAT